MLFVMQLFFLAYDNRRIVGRIGVIINRESNRKWNERVARFTHFDFIDDLNVSRKLMDAARDYARKKGMTSIRGPLGFTDMDHQGMLVEGFNELDMFITIYNHPYYIRHMMILGLKRDRLGGTPGFHSG